MTDTDAVFRENTKPKPTNENKPAVGDDTAATGGASAQAGDVPHHTDAPGGGSFETSEDAFRAAAGLESSSTTGKKSFSISQFDSNVGQGEGISRGQVVKYTGEDGTTIQGGQYHNKDGTFFKTPEGNTYKVQMDSSTNSYSLQPTKPGQQPIEATQRDVVSNSFGQFGNQFRQNNGGDNGGNAGQSGDLGRAKRTNDGTTGSGTTDTTTAVAASATKVAPVAPENAVVAKVVAPPATLQSDHTVAAAVVAPVATALQTGDRSTLSATQPVIDRSIAPAQTMPAAKLSDPAQFYSSFKGASGSDKTNLVASLAALPTSERSDFIRQVVDVAKTTDRTGAAGVLTDLNKTVYAIARGDNPTVSAPQSGPAKISDGSTVGAQPATPARIADAGVVSGQPGTTPKGDLTSLQPAVKIADPNVGNAALSTNLAALKNPAGTTDGGVISSLPRALQTPDSGNGGQRIALNPDAAKVVTTSVEGALIKPGQLIDGAAKIAQIQGGDPSLGRGVLGQQPGGIAGGDSFKPDPRNIPGQGQPIDSSILAGRGLDGKIVAPGLTPGMINSGDKILIGAQTPLPDALARGHGQPGDGNLANNPLGQISARGRDGADLPQSGLLPQQRNLIPGLDINDPQTKAFLTDALRQLQATKVGDFDPRNQNQSLQDILKGFDPHKVDRLQAFLNPDGKVPITDAAVGRLAAALSPGAAGAERLTGSAATDLTLGQRTAIDRLTDLVRNNQNLIDLTTMQTRDSRMLLEINKMVGDVNKQFGFEGKNVLGLGDIIGRSLDGTKGGERGGGEGRGALDRPISQDPLSFTARLTPTQEQAIRAFLENRELRAATSDHANASANPLFAGRQIELTGKQDQHAKVEPALKPELPGKIDGKPDLAGKQDLAGKPELNVKHDLPGKSELTGRLEPKTDLTPIKSELTGKSDLTGKELVAKGDLISKNDPAGKQEIVRTEQVIRPPDVKDKDERSDRIDALVPFGKHENNATNLDGTPKNKAQIEKELAEKQKEERARQEEAQRREAAMMTLMADRKLREEKEKQQKEEEKLREKKQDEEDRRRRYVVREKDTLESIASKQLKDAKLAGLIQEINIKELATKREHGREVPDLRPRQVIWLPSGVDIREYRKRVHSGSSSMSASDSKLTAQEELALRFGKNWGGGASNGGTESGAPADTEHGVSPELDQAAELSPAAVAAAQKRRANIESLLGPLAKHIPADGRIRYVVRLGDTLKSVAMKHPSLQDISLWQLLAVINDIPTDTDDRGIPQAKLSRGSTLMLPSVEEIESFRDKHGVRTTPLERNTKSCPQCGRMSAAGAPICGACAHSFNIEKPRLKPSDAGMVVMEAAGFVAKPGMPLTKRPAPPPETLPEEAAPALPTPLYQPGVQLAIVPLDEQTRLARCINHGETPTTVVVVEVSREDSWQPVVAYEIFAHNSMRHEYTPRGDRKSVRIDLPIDAILELSNNDLKGNWKNYRDRYFAQLISLNR